MPAPPARPARKSPPLTPTEIWTGWGVFGAIAFVGFCFGVWVGTQRPPKPAPVEVADASATPADDTKPPPPTTPQLPPPPTTQPQPAPPPPPPTVKAPEPTRKVEPTKKAEPPKPTAKKPADPPATPVVNNVSFAKDVIPVFRTHCLNCHGVVGKPKGDTDLRTIAAMMANSGALTPGNPAKSTIWTQIADGDMPPPDKPKMTPAEKQTVKDWIAGGAKP